MMRRFEPAVVGVLIVLALIGVAVRVLALPFVTEAMFRATGGGAESGLDSEVALETALSVRSYVVGAGTHTLPTRVQDREGFTPEALSHLEDVRAVFSTGMWATALCLLLAAVWGFVRLRRARKDLMRRAAVWAGGEALVAVALAAFAGFVDFDRFFAGFHALFFEGGTWLFPPGDLLIQLFPEPFWVLAGALWGATVALGAVGLLVYGMAPRGRLAHTARPNGA